MTDGLHQLGKYQIAEELGAGGFATVFRANDTTLDREVALKILHPPLLADRHFVQNFRQEARTLARLRHPQIITIYEVGDIDGRLFIAMDLARGVSLGKAIAARQRIPWDETLALLKPIAEALDYAHAQGVVHRDLKPSNILIDSQHGALLTDFGFAKLLAENPVSVAMSSGIVGTPGYIAPEVWENNAADPPVDIYALGCIACEMLTGAVLFKGATPIQAMRAHDRGPQFPAEWPADVPPTIADALSTALARDPAERYPNAGAFWQALSRLGQAAPAAAVALPPASTPVLENEKPAEVQKAPAAPPSIAPAPSVSAAEAERPFASLPPAENPAADPTPKVNLTPKTVAATPRSSLSLALMLLPLSIALDIGGGELVKRFQLPLWLDNGGTILMGMLFGPWLAALAALAGRVVWWLLGWNDASLWFSPSVIATGLLAGFAGQFGLFRSSPPRWLSAVIGGVLGFGMPLLALQFLNISPHEGSWPSLPAASDLVANHGSLLLVATALGAALGFYLLKQMGYAGLAGLSVGAVAGTIAAPSEVVLFGSELGGSISAALFGQNRVSDPLDKLILFLIIFYVVRALPRPLLQRFPNTRAREDVDAEEQEV